jgi:5,10-methenyltetrahydrofolate synthetase
MGSQTRPENMAEERLAYRRLLRRSLIEQRRALPAAECARLSACLCQHLRKRFPQLAVLRVAFCWPMHNEADVRPLIEEWLNKGNQGFAALLPVVLEKNAALAFRPWRLGAPLLADRYGIPTPSSGDFVTPDALLLPVNAFDAAGYRLGYGGGYFDRTLAALNLAGQHPLVIGTGFELARVSSIRPEPHDLPLDAIVTEQGVFIGTRSPILCNGAQA